MSAEIKTPTFMEKVMHRMDGWMNILTGVGTRSKDARTYSKVRWRRMTEDEQEHLYAGDGMAAKLVDLPVDESMKKGYEWTGIPEASIKKLSEYLALLGFDACIMEAAKKARIYGGSIILKNYTDDMELQDPVNAKRKNEIKSIFVLHRWEAYSTWTDLDRNLLSSGFGKPIWYNFIARNSSITPLAGVKIHKSRTVRFDGSYLPEKLKTQNGYWDDSIFSKLYDPIRNYADAHDSVSAVLKDFSVGVFKVKGLADAVSSNTPEGDKTVTDRMNIVNLSKSVARMVLIDADGEDFDYKTRTVTGVKDMVEKVEGRLVAESSFPRTVLLGESPQGGLGQTGNHEQQNWYDFIACYQKNYMKPKMLELAKEVGQSMGIDTAKLDIIFNPLFQLTQKEEVEMRVKQSEMDQRYHDMGVVDTFEITESRFGGEKYSIETKVDMKLRKRPTKEEFNKPDDEEGEIDKTKKKPEAK